MVDVQNMGRASGAVDGLPRGIRTAESIRNLEQVCCEETKRLVRTRMLGVVGGVRSKAAPIPIAWLSAVLKYSVIVLERGDEFVIGEFFRVLAIAVDPVD